MIYSVAEKDLDKFNNLAPAYILAQAKMADYHTFSYIEDNEPKGLIVFFHSREDNVIMIKWFYVDDKYRNRCIADQLLAQVMQVSLALKTNSVMIQLPATGENTPLYNVFWRCGFTFKKEKGRKYLIPIQEIIESTTLKKADHSAIVKPLNQISLKEYRGFLFKNNLIGDARLGIHYPLYRDNCDQTSFNPAHCFATLNNEGEIRGLFLIEQLENQYYMPVFLTESSKNIAAALSLVKKTFTSIYSENPSALIVCDIFSDKSINLVQHVFPDKEFSDEIIMSRTL